MSSKLGAIQTALSQHAIDCHLRPSSAHILQSLTHLKCLRMSTLLLFARQHFNPDYVASPTRETSSVDQFGPAILPRGSNPFSSRSGSGRPSARSFRSTFPSRSRCQPSLFPSRHIAQIIMSYLKFLYRSYRCGPYLWRAPHTSQGIFGRLLVIDVCGKHAHVSLVF